MDVRPLYRVSRVSRGRNFARFFAAVTALNSAVGAAAAETPPPPDKQQTQIPEKAAPPLENGAKEHKMQREDGVIKPPSNIDPGMIGKPPETGGRMPVIPPPGSPGGDPSLKPK